MNLGQLFETQLWALAKFLWVRFAVPTFGSFGLNEFEKLVEKCWLSDQIRITLYDWETWEPYAQKVTVWYMHILKLVHMVEDKIHARSVWPYSLITQQPLGWKSRQWWQRFGEMEVWSLEAYSAVYTLQEMLTVKSDDVVWRNKLYEAIIKWQKPKIWWLPESFNLVSYLFKWLWQNVIPLTVEEMENIHLERTKKIKDLWLSWLLSWPLATDWWLYESEDSNQEKEELIENVIKEMEDFWEIEDN